MSAPGSPSRFFRVRIGTLTRTAAVVLAAVVVLVAPSDALAARSVPKGFFGMNWDQEVTYRTSPATRSTQWGKMAASGAESARAIFWWKDAQPKKDGPTDYRATDALVTLAAEHGLELIPVVIAAPRWARTGDKPFSPPNRGAYAKYLVKLVERYGVDGKFWKKHTSIPKRPILALQIWNEPTLQYQWTIPSSKDWAVGYGKLLCKSHSAVKDADHRVRVVMAGLPNASSGDLDHLYAKGHVHGCFDVGAIHPYTVHKGGVLTRCRYGPVPEGLVQRPDEQPREAAGGSRLLLHVGLRLQGLDLQMDRAVPVRPRP